MKFLGCLVYIAFSFLLLHYHRVGYLLVSRNYTLRAWQIGWRSCLWCTLWKISWLAEVKENKEVALFQCLWEIPVVQGEVSKDEWLRSFSRWRINNSETKLFTMKNKRIWSFSSFLQWGSSLLVCLHIGSFVASHVPLDERTEIFTSLDQKEQDLKHWPYLSKLNWTGLIVQGTKHILTMTWAIIPFIKFDWINL